MTAVVAQPARTSPRLSYQRHVAALLDEIEQRRRRLLLLRTNGALPAGLRDLKTELQAVRDELAATVLHDSASSAAHRGRSDGAWSALPSLIESPPSS